MSRHSDDGPPGGTSDQHPTQDPGPWTAPGGAPDPAPHWHHDQPTGDQGLPSWVVTPATSDPDAGPGPGPGPGPAEPPDPGAGAGATPAAPGADEGPLGHIPPDVPQPGPPIPERPMPDLSSPPAQGEAGHPRPDPTAEGEGAGPARLRGFRRRQLPPPDPHRQAPALPAGGAGGEGPGVDPSESRTIVAGHTAPPGQLGPGPVSHGQHVPSPLRTAPIPRAQSGPEPPGGHPGLGATGPPGEPAPPDFPVPPELPTPPVRRPGAGLGEPGPGRSPGPGQTPDLGGPGSAAPATPPAGPAPRTASGAPRPGQMAAQPRRMTPEQIRTTTFGRSALGRRGYNEDEVNQFANRLAEELAARDAEVVRLIDENHRLKQAMRDWQSERIDQPEADVAERVNAETAAMMAKAQQHIDAQLAQTELYCRQREQEAARRYDEIVRHARLQVKREAEQVAHRYRATSGAGYNPDQETLQRQQVYIGALLQALDALGAHVQATRQAFATEIGKLTPSPTPTENPPQRVD